MLQGDLDFATAEQTLRAARELAAAVGWFVLDLTRVGRIEPVAADLVRALGEDLRGRGVRMVLADPDERQAMSRTSDEFPDLGRALESCEDALLVGLGLDPEAPVPLADCDLFGRADARLRAALAEAFDTRHLAAGRPSRPRAHRGPRCWNGSCSGTSSPAASPSAPTRRAPSWCAAPGPRAPARPSPRPTSRRASPARSSPSGTRCAAP
ncbi:STAS domain-containing protein [Streptomyces sp. Q6]|uniref:STAS domain-containing protein n=1 Tax=Streptomyces citrinus TaxID=3118173 RepID=A0ACD5A5E4_9ACTN